MTDPGMTLVEYLRSVGAMENADYLREGIRLLSQWQMELEVSEQIGAVPYERTAERTTKRNRYRDRISDYRIYCRARCVRQQLGHPVHLKQLASDNCESSAP